MSNPQTFKFRLYSPAEPEAGYHEMNETLTVTLENGGWDIDQEMLREAFAEIFGCVCLTEKEFEDDLRTQLDWEAEYLKPPEEESDEK